MSVWIAAAIALACGFIPCALIAARADLGSALVALNLAGMLTITALMVLCVGFGRQPFIDLAVVLGPASAVGLLAFVRFLERQR